MIGRIRQWFDDRRLRRFVETNPGSREPWSSGDLAVCIEASWISYRDEIPTEGPVVNEVYRVARVDCFFGKPYLCLHGLNPLAQWNAAAFRKAELKQAEACDADFIKLLKRSKRKVSA